MTNGLHRFTGISILALAIAGGAASPAFARTEITPYLEVDQTVTAQLKGNSNDDVLTYTSAVAGVDVTIEQGKTTAQINYQYEHRFGWGKKLADEDVHTGLARVSHEVTNSLNIEAGALAARAKQDSRGDAPSLLVGNVDNVSQVYSFYAGPTYHNTMAGVDVDAAYRLGYNMVEANDYIPPAGQPRLDSYDDSLSHLAMASVGMRPGELPIGWKVSAAYEREDAGQLDQRFESKGVRGDVTVPVSPTVALVGGVGYEKVEASERAPLIAGGAPVVDAKGRYVTDPNSPRLSSYDFDGLYWDVGAEWRPSERTQLGVHVGRRYGSWSYTGGLSWAIDNASSLQISVYDDVQTFGQQLSDGLARIPTSFGTSRNGLSPQFGGCVFGGEGSDSTGGCLPTAFQGVNSSVYRTRGMTAMYNRSLNRASLGLGIGYEERKYQTPNIAGAFTLDGISDKAYFAQANMGYQLGRSAGIDSSVFMSYSQSGINGAPDVLSSGATAGLYKTFGRRLSARASLGLYSFDVDGLDSEINTAGQVGLRYSF